jgi:hypothetical protein
MSARDDLPTIRADEETATEILAMLVSPGIEPMNDPWAEPFAWDTRRTAWNRP